MGSFLTMARLLAILMTPMARVTVTTIGRPSGMAATARLNNHTYYTNSRVYERKYTEQYLVTVKNGYVVKSKHKFLSCYLLVFAGFLNV